MGEEKDDDGNAKQQTSQIAKDCAFNYLAKGRTLRNAALNMHRRGPRTPKTATIITF